MASPINSGRLCFIPRSPCHLAPPVSRLARLLIAKVLVEDAPGIDKALILVIFPELYNGFYGIGSRAGFFDIANIIQRIAGNMHLLTDFKRVYLLHLEEVRTNYADRQHHQAKVHDIAAIALAIAFDEHIQRQRIRLTVSMAHEHATPQFIENSPGGKCADSKANIRPDIAHTDQRQHGGTESGGERGHG